MSEEPVPKSVSDALKRLAALNEHVGDSVFPWEGVSPVSPDQMPDAYRRLLVHDNHMTPTLKAFHSEAVELRVLAYHTDDRWYCRKIVLTTDAGRHAVEFGLVRLDLNTLPDPVRRAVLERATPLGDILIGHGVMTHVEPKWFLKFSATHSVSVHFAPADGGSYFGRLATIHCNGAPAMELLEVVTDRRRQTEG